MIMAEQGKTLIILTPGFPENEADTTCLPFLQTHVQALNKVYPETEFIVIAFQYPFVKKEYEWYGNKVIAMGGRSLPKLHRVKIWLQVWRKLGQLKKTKNVIGLFSLWCTECALVGSYFGKWKQVKHQIWLCGQDARKDNKYVALTRPKGEELIAMSDFLNREFFANYSIRPAHVIPIGVNPLEIANAPAERNIDILGVGSLIPLKQYHIFIEVVQALVAHLPGVRAAIYGQGPEEEELKKQIIDNRLQEHVQLMGEAPHALVLKEMQHAKIFLHTSNYEGFGTVCLEALHAGAHVVSFTKPMDTVIEHWHHVNSKEEMIVMVRELLSDTQLSTLSVTPFTTDSIASSLMNLFEN